MAYQVYIRFFRSSQDQASNMYKGEQYSWTMETSFLFGTHGQLWRDRWCGWIPDLPISGRPTVWSRFLWIDCMQRHDPDHCLYAINLVQNL